MSVKIKITWDDLNVISEGVRIYKNASAFTSSSLPAVYTTVTYGVVEFEDLDVVEKQTYFYMLSSFLDEQEVFTDCYEVNVESTTPPDPQLSTVTLLMQFDANPLKDPISDVTWTLYGDAYVDTVDKKIGSGALHLSDAVTSYARSPVLTNMYTPNVSGKTITVEFWFKKTSPIGNAGAVCFQNADNPSNRYAFFMRSGANDFKVAVYTTSTSTFIDTTANLSLNEWVHFAYVEGGDNMSKLYINGVSKINVAANRPIIFWDRTIATLGQSGLDAEPFGGLIDGLRVSKFARYTANFVPPDKPFASS